MLSFSKKLVTSISALTLVAASFTASTAYAVDNTPIQDIPVATSTDLNNVAPNEYVIVSTEGNNDALLQSMPSYKELINENGNTTALLTKADAEKIDSQIPDAVIETNQKVSVDGSVTQNSVTSWAIDRLDSPTYVSDSTYTYNSDGTGVKIYIVDTGINAHQDFSARLAAGYDGIGDGYGTTDCDGHGTFVAGFAAGTIYGVAKNATLIPVRTMDCTGSGYTTDVIAGLNWIMNNHSGGKGVINMSLGGGVSTAMDNAVQAAIDAGFVVVVAAGNGGADSIGDDACSGSPARLPAAYTVAASDSTNTLPSWTNYGSCVDMVAPGENVRSTIGTNQIGDGNGTSFSSPIVAGMAARYWQMNPSLTPAQLMALMSSSSVQGVLSNAASKSTVNKLVYMTGETPVVVTAPDAPTTLATSATTSSQTTLSWNAPTNNGGAAITDYIIKYSPDNGVTEYTFDDGISTNLTATITGLTASTSYLVSVAAVNSAGTSAYTSTTVSTIAAIIPSNPVNNFRVTSNVYGSISLGWDAPTSSGSAPVTDYVITYSRDSGSTWNTWTDPVTTTTGITIKNLAQGVYYWFRVQAKTTVGLSEAKQVSLKTVPLSKPTAPRNFTIKYNTTTKMTLAWLPPLSSGSAPVTDYILTYSIDGGKTFQTYNDGVNTSTTLNITNFQHGKTYIFLLRAKNNVGVSPAVQISVLSR